MGGYKGVDLVGQRFGGLTVISMHNERQGRSNRALWNCRCDCGKVLTVRTDDLKRKNPHYPRSCGCANLGKFIDITGKRFGKLTVISQADERNKFGQLRWNCQCDCGKLRVTTGNQLQQGTVTSCGSYTCKWSDLSGHRFGSLIVLSHAGFTKGRRSLWNVTCDCGKTCVVYDKYLKNGHCGCRTFGIFHEGDIVDGLKILKYIGRDRSNTKRWEYQCLKCGFIGQKNTSNLRRRGCPKCAYEERKYPFDLKNPAINKMHRTYCNGAAARGLSFNLSPEEFTTLVKANCVYCGAPPKPCNGIDRVDNALGYIASNCVSCCRACNISKYKFDVYTWIAHCRAVADNEMNIRNTLETLKTRSI